MLQNVLWTTVFDNKFGNDSIRLTMILRIIPKIYLVQCLDSLSLSKHYIHGEAWWWRRHGIDYLELQGKENYE